jgi:DGQHR domain-containing protein
MGMKAFPNSIKVRALQTTQGKVPIYSLFMPGAELHKIADIARVERNGEGKLEGFQRREIRDHVNEIAAYLDKQNVLFPNAIILALSPDVKFKQSRGPALDATFNDVVAGQLEIPVRPEGERVAWIVDGQQRTIALKKSRAGSLPVPVVAFETASIETLREQFILVNRARPLPQGLIDELLPETSGILLPRDLSTRRLPSALCNALDQSKSSPFFGLIKRSSQKTKDGRVVIDTAVINMIKRSLANPTGALALYQDPGAPSGDSNKMARLLIEYWSAVKDVFPKAWGKDPSESRLMHSAGIVAMGDLMDRMTARAPSNRGLKLFFVRELTRIAKHCAWTDGVWPKINRRWNEIEYTTRDVKLLSQVLVQLYAERSAQ